MCAGTSCRTGKQGGGHRCGVTRGEGASSPASPLTGTRSSDTPALTAERVRGSQHIGSRRRGEWGLRRRDAAKDWIPQAHPLLKKRKGLEKASRTSGEPSTCSAGTRAAVRAGVQRGHGWRRPPRGSARRVLPDMWHRCSLKSAHQTTASTAGDACW